MTARMDEEDWAHVLGVFRAYLPPVWTQSRE